MKCKLKCLLILRTEFCKYWIHMMIIWLFCRVWGSISLLCFFKCSREHRLFEMLWRYFCLNVSFSLSLLLDFCRIFASGIFYEKPLFTFRALGLHFFLTICVYRDNMILAKHVVQYLCKNCLVLQIGNKWRPRRPLMFKETLNKLSSKYIFLNCKDKASTLLS